MCSVSMVTDDWKNNYWYPDILQTPIRSEELKKELKKARQQDIEDGAPDCEMKKSVNLLKKLAEHLGVDLEDVFEGHK